MFDKKGSRKVSITSLKNRFTASENKDLDMKKLFVCQRRQKNKSGFFVCVFRAKNAGI